MQQPDSDTGQPQAADTLSLSRMNLRLAVRTMWRDASRMMQLIAAAAPGSLRWVAFAAMLEAVAATLLPYTTRGLIDSLPGASPTALLVPMSWLAFEAVVVLTRLLGTNLMRHEVRIIELSAGPFLTARLLAKSCRVPYARFEQGEFLNRFARARQDAPLYGVGFAVHCITIVRSALVFLGCAALLLWVAPAWTLPLLALAVLPAFLLEVAKARRSFALEQENMQRNRQGWYLDWLMSTAEPVKEVRALGIGPWLVRLFEGVHAPFRRGQVALTRGFLRRHAAFAIVTTILMYLPYAYFVWTTLQGQASLGELLFFVLAFNQCSTALTQLLGSLAASFEHHLYVHNLLHVLDDPEEESDTEPSAGNVLAAAPEFVIENLWFTYPGRSQPVLRGLDLQVRAGETLAIVGRNGIGKTTLVKLLLGLYPLQRGRFLIGGIDVGTRPMGWRRDNIGVVMQDFVRYQFSAAEAVGVGWSPDAGDAEAVARALRMAEAHELVAELPHGGATPLGPAFGGHDLSGGQWQRMALARLFMRRSRLWIMDEPTSAMDPETEERTFRCFRQWTQGRTAIIITHRYTTARIADRIAVIDGGQVVEIGTHDELLARDGQYARIFEMQAQAFARS